MHECAGIVADAGRHLRAVQRQGGRAGVADVVERHSVEARRDGRAPEAGCSGGTGLPYVAPRRPPSPRARRGRARWPASSSSGSSAARGAGGGRMVGARERGVDGALDGEPDPDGRFELAGEHPGDGRERHAASAERVDAGRGLGRGGAAGQARCWSRRLARRRRTSGAHAAPGPMGAGRKMRACRRSLAGLAGCASSGPGGRDPPPPPRPKPAVLTGTAVLSGTAALAKFSPRPDTWPGGLHAAGKPAATEPLPHPPYHRHRPEEPLPHQAPTAGGGRRRAAAATATAATFAVEFRPTRAATRNRAGLCFGSDDEIRARRFATTDVAFMATDV